jgi:SAM-dependent methyltransferase
MREYAEQVTEAPNVSYVGASAYETGLPDGCADLATAAQSLQWMELDRVLPEIARVLRVGGVFCAYNYFRLQLQDWEVMTAFENEQRLKHELNRATLHETFPVEADVLDAGGHFRAVRDFVLHSVEEGDGERLLGFALSEGSLRMLLEQGVSEKEIGVDRLRAACAALRDPVSWWIGYRVWLCLK